MIAYHPKNGPGLLLLDHHEARTYESFGGSTEIHLIQWALAALPIEGKTFVDIGAHIGTWALSFAPHAKNVVAFEAMWRTYCQLCGGIALNDHADTIVAHHVALGAETKDRADFFMMQRNGGGSSLNYYTGRDESLIRTEQTRLTTLDSFDLENVGLIKLDVEGAELEVLRGSVRTLERSGYPRILFESWLPEWRGEWAKPLREELFHHLESLGYTIVPVAGYPEQFLAEMKP